MSCPACPHCIAAGAFGLIDPADPALTTNQPQPLKVKRLHKAASNHYSVCGVFAFRYQDRRSGASVDSWDDVTCRACLKEKPR